MKNEVSTRGFCFFARRAKRIVGYEDDLLLATPFPGTRMDEMDRDELFKCPALILKY